MSSLRDRVEVKLRDQSLGVEAPSLRIRFWDQGLGVGAVEGSGFRCLRLPGRGRRPSGAAPPQSIRASSGSASAPAVWGMGLRVESVGCRVEGVGCRVWSVRCRV